MQTNKRILVAVDGSAASRRTVAYVATMVGAGSGFHVGLLHLELPPRMLEWGGSEDPKIEDEVSRQRAEIYHELEEEVLEGGQKLLQKLQQPFTERKVDVVSQLVQFEEPLDPEHISRHILKTAQERHYGTVVVGWHSFSGLRRLFGHHVGEELIITGSGVTLWVVE